MRAGLVAFSLWFAGAALAWPQAPLTPSQFRDRIVAAVQTIQPGVEFEATDELGGQLTLADKTTVQVAFANGYDAYLRTPSDLDMLVDRFARAAVGQIEWGHSADRIISVLRHEATVTDLRLPGGSPVPIVWRPFVGDLIEVLAFDSAETIAYASEEALRDIGLDASQAWVLAPVNLASRMGPLEGALLDEYPGLALISEPNGLAPSVLATPDFCTTSQGTRSVFVVVQRDAFLIAMKSDPVAVSNLRRLAGMLADTALSQSILECRDGRMQAHTSAR
jgi:hypothetical protein